jgi:hypothetical protein
MFHMGGAVARVPCDATAYAARDVAHNIVIDAVCSPKSPASGPQPRPVGRDSSSKPFNPTAPPASTSTPSIPTTTSRVREAYGEQIYRRLAEVKAEYDPDNAFHHNKNIQPG